MEVPFRLDSRRDREAAIVEVSGELDLASSPRLAAELDRVWESGAQLVIVDLRSVEFMDSSGLRVLVGAHQRAKGNGKRFGVVNGGEQVQKLLDLTRVNDALTVVDSPEQLLVP